jgi:hypothetical protein
MHLGLELGPELLVETQPKPGDGFRKQLNGTLEAHQFFVSLRSS